VDDSSWARATAEVFYHKLEKKVKFKDIYSYLLDAAEMDVCCDSEHEDDEDYVDEEDESNKNSKNTLNGLLFKEFHDWYQAFLKEEDDGDEEAGDADERWVRHATSVLSRRLKMSKEDLKLQVEDWLSRRVDEVEYYRTSQ
jgi:hypothetical protein